MNMYKLFQNISKFLICGLCLSTFCVMSCDDSDDQDSPHPHGTVAISKEVSDFFQTFNFFFGSNPPFFTNTVWYKDTCCIVNSQEELARNYTGSEQLPAIDFSSVTLIIGKAYVTSGNFYVYDQRIIGPDANQSITLHLVFKDDRMGHQANASLFYWGFYPKFEAKEIKVIKENNNYEWKYGLLDEESYD